MPAIAPVDSPVLFDDGLSEAFGVFVLLAEVGVDDAGNIELLPVGVRCNAYVAGLRLAIDVICIVAPFTAEEVASAYIRSKWHL
jgi:hypothetical protein